MTVALISLFVLSANARINGDNSMSWFVLLGIIFLITAHLCGNCTN